MSEDSASSEPVATTRGRFGARAAVGLVVLATLVALLPSLRAGYIWDDALLIEHNRMLAVHGAAWRALTHGFWDVESVEPGEASYYRPLVTLFFVASRAAFGLAPAAWHAAVVALHLAAVALCGRWLYRAVGDDPLAVGLGTAVFALHATRAESVVWLVGSTDVLASIFTLLALLAALPPRGENPRVRAARLVAASAFATAALLAKETALVLPAALGVACAATWPAGRERARAVAGFVAAPALALAATVLVRVTMVPLPSSPATPPLARHAALVLETLGWYARMLVWPWPLSLIHAPLQFDRAGVHVDPWGVLAGLATAAALGFGLVRLAKRVPVAAAGLAIAVGFLLPVLNVRWLGLTWLAAEHYLYLPSIGLALAAAAGLARARPSWRRPLAIAGATLALIHAGSIARRALDFRDEATFWASEARMHPDVPVVLVGEARAAIDQGRDGRGFDLLRRAFARSAAYQPGPRLGHDLVRALDAALLVVPDDDRASLEGALAFLRGLRDPRVAVARGRVLGWSLGYDKRVLGAPIADDGPWIRSLEASVLSRLGRDDEARGAARDALGACALRCGEVALNAALVCARARDWPCAFAANDRAIANATDAAAVAHQRAQLEAARAHDADAAQAPSSAQRALYDAEVDVFLAQPEAARARLADAAPSVRSRLLAIRVELLEYHFAAADAAIAALRAGAPPSAEPVFAELAALEARQRARIEGLVRGGN